MNTIPGGIAGAELRSFVERIEWLEADKRGLADDIKEVYAEAKARGFSVRVMRNVVKRRRVPEQQRADYDELLDLYEHALEHALEGSVKTSVPKQENIGTARAKSEAATA